MNELVTMMADELTVSKEPDYFKLSREEFIQKHMSLVWDVVEKKFKKSFGFQKERNGLLPEDLVSMGYIGLIKAYDNYNPDKNTKFSTYAYTTIWGYILQQIRDTCSVFKLSSQLKEKSMSIISKGLIHEKPEVIQAKTGYSMDDIKIILDVERDSVFEELQSVAVKDEGENVWLYELIRGNGLEQLEFEVMIKDLKKKFNKHEVIIFELCLKGLPQRDIFSHMRKYRKGQRKVRTTIDKIKREICLYLNINMIE